MADRGDPRAPLSSRPCGDGGENQEGGPGCRRWLRRLRRAAFSEAAEVREGGEGGREDEAPGYSFRNEVRYFFYKGIPLGLSSVLNWGIPPLVAMIFAGHTQQSAHLQASMGYGRVWYNCTALMPAVGMFAYVSNVVPGCIGAGRRDRIPRYLQRGIVLSLLVMLPLYALQLAAGSIMEGLGVPADNARDVGEYCRWMIITSILTILDGNIETCFVNLGYARCATINSFVSGIGVDIVCTYLFIFQWDWGIRGAAFAQMMVKVFRVFVWAVLALVFGLVKTLCVAPRDAEPLFPRRECRVFASLAGPQILSNFAGWLIFEFQVMMMTNIRGVPKDALAAGAVWVQIESSLAAAQDGWLRTTSMRSLVLLGKQDPGARKAFLLFNRLADSVVLLSNVFLLVFQGGLCRLVSNDESVQEWLRKIVWVLAIHTQSRISCLNAQFLFIPLGRGMLRTVVTFISFYLIATPLSGAIALTDVFTNSVTMKMMACVGSTSIAQVALGAYSFYFLRRLDWHEAGEIINRRANNDKRQADDLAAMADGGCGAGATANEAELPATMRAAAAAAATA